MISDDKQISAFGGAEYLHRYLTWLGVGETEPVELTAIRPANMRGAKMAVAYGLGSDAAVNLAATADSGPDWLGAEGIYVLPAKLAPGVHARYSLGSWHRAENHAKDHEVTRRRVVYIDLDPLRATGISSTRAEQAAAKAAAAEVYRLLRDAGIDKSVGIGSSGNGFQVHLAVDLEPGADDLVKRLLRVMSVLIGGDRWGHPIDVDQTVHNAARICPAFGTVKRKGTDFREGDEAQWRPHRRSSFMAIESKPPRLDAEAFEGVVVALESSITAEQRDALTRMTEGQPTVSNSPGTISPESLIAKAKQHPIAEVVSWLGLDEGGGKVRCPGCGETQGVAILTDRNRLKCLHNRCAGKGRGNGCRSNIDLMIEVNGWPKDKVSVKRAAEAICDQFRIAYEKGRAKKVPTGLELSAMAGLSLVESAALVGIVIDEPANTLDDGAALDNLEQDAAPAPPRETARRNLTDLGNAERLLDRHGDNIRWVTSWRKWIVWDGKRWVEDADGTLVGALANDTVRSIYLEAAAEPDPKMKGEIAGWAKSSESDKRLKAMVARATTLVTLHLHHDQLDADPYTLNCPNGVLNLKTGKLRPHDRLAYSTKLTLVPYNPKADRTTFERAFQRSLPDPEVREYVMKLMGKSLTANTEDHILPVHYNSRGRNGKDTFLGSLMVIMGEYADEIPFEILEQTGTGHPTGLSLLFGKRMVLSSETGKGEALNVKLAKRLTGENKVQTRKMQQDFWGFLPSHTLHLATNHRPRIVADKKDPIWERVSLIEWAHIPSADRDPKLKAKLRGEHAEGFFASVVDACLRWQRDGLVQPESVRLATSDYRDESDTFGDFVDECLILDPTAIGAKATRLADIHAKYVEWSEGVGLRHPLARNGLARELNEREMGTPDRDASNRAVRQGVRLRTFADDPAQAKAHEEAVEELAMQFGVGRLDDEQEDWLAPSSFTNVKH